MGAGPRQLDGALTPWCCHTSIPNTVSWQGICWGKENAAACNEAPNGRCEWDAARCFQTAPTCLFQGDLCRTNEDCCSNACRMTGTESTCKWMDGVDRGVSWIICCWWFFVFYFGSAPKGVLLSLCRCEFSVSFILAFYMIFSSIFCLVLLSFCVLYCHLRVNERVLVFV